MVFCDIRESQGNELAEEIGGNAYFVAADVSSRSDVEHLVNQIEKKYGKLNAVVSCAGIANSYMLHNFNKGVSRTLEDFTKLIQVL